METNTVTEISKIINPMTNELLFLWIKFYGSLSCSIGLTIIGKLTKSIYWDLSALMFGIIVFVNIIKILRS